MEKIPITSDGKLKVEEELKTLKPPNDQGLLTPSQKQELTEIYLKMLSIMLQKKSKPIMRPE